MPRRIATIVLAFAIVATACGGDGDESSAFPAGAFALSASSNLAVGTERLLVAVVAQDGARLSSPDIPVTVRVRPEGGEATEPMPATFMWAIPDNSGLYRVTVEFPTAGTWFIEVIPEGGGNLPEFPVTVLSEPITVGLGRPAPESDTPTAADSDLAAISSDDDPDPRFYELSVAEAVTSGRPSVIVFSTPEFCSTGVCGPTLDDLKAMAPSYPEVNFVHVEVFTNLDDPDNLAVVPAVQEWGLPTEPWVFVVDAAGIVIGRFEGVISSEEIAELLGQPSVIGY